jgi:hypothetical protein
MNINRHRRPVEAIERRVRRSEECEQRVKAALKKLIRTGAPFTVENVCDLSGVGKTFIYDKRRPDLTRVVLEARDASQVEDINHEQQRIEDNTASWRERAHNAEALAQSLRSIVKDRDARITDLIGQLYDPEGTHLADENSALRRLVVTFNANLQQLQNENNALRRSLDAARANVKRERERNVTHIYGPASPPHLGEGTRV